MSIFAPLRKGSWWIRSKTKPEWNESGDSDSVGGFMIPSEATAAIERKKQTLGEPPDDLEWGYMKD